MDEKRVRNYFSHDSNARSDEKLIALRIKYNWAGYGLYWALIEKLRDATCHKLSTDYNIIAYDLRADAATIKSIVCDFGLFAFTENGECFYSESLMRRMEKMDDKTRKLSEAGKLGNERRWGKKAAPKEADDLEAIPSQSPPDRHPIAIKLNKTKENKRNNSDEEEVSTSDLTPSREEPLQSYSSSPSLFLDEIWALLSKPESLEKPWLNSVGNLYHLDSSALAGYLQEFFAHLRADGVTQKRLSDFKRHFNAWLRIKQDVNRRSAGNADTWDQLLQDAKRLINQ